METKQICAKALLNLIAEDTLPTLIKVPKSTPGLPHSSHANVRDLLHGVRVNNFVISPRRVIAAAGPKSMSPWNSLQDT